VDPTDFVRVWSGPSSGIWTLVITDTARMLCGAHSSKPAAARLLLWNRRTGQSGRLLQQRRANAGSDTFSAYEDLLTDLLTTIQRLIELTELRVWVPNTARSSSGAQFTKYLTIYLKTILSLS